LRRPGTHRSSVLRVGFRCILSLGARMRKRYVLLIAASLVPSLSDAVRAQDCFMLGQAESWVNLRAGWLLHRPVGDFLCFCLSELILDRDDFRAPAVAGEFGTVVHPRIDLIVGAAWSKAETTSESRDYVEEVDGVDVPIRQTTSLRVLPVTA